MILKCASCPARVERRTLPLRGETRCFDCKMARVRARNKKVKK